MAKFTGGLDALKERHSRLVARRDAAHTVFKKADAAWRSQLLDADDTDNKTTAVLRQKLNDAEAELKGLDELIAEQARRVADAERALADEATKAACKAASEALAADVAKMERQLAPWLASTRSLASELEKYSTFRFEAGGIARFLNNAAAEIEIALGLTIPDFKSAIAAVAEGRESAPAAPTPVRKIVQPTPPPTKTIFFTRASKWTDAAGKLHVIQKFTDAILPPELAAHAVKVGAAVELKSPLRKQNIGTWGGRQLHAEHAFALDEASANAPVVHSAFEPHPNVGKPYTIKAAPVAMAATRDMPTKK